MALMIDPTFSDLIFLEIMPANPHIVCSLCPFLAEIILDEQLDIAKNRPGINPADEDNLRK